MLSDLIKLIKYFEFEVWVSIIPIRPNLSSDMMPFVIKLWTEISASGFLQLNYIGNTFFPIRYWIAIEIELENMFGLSG